MKNGENISASKCIQCTILELQCNLDDQGCENCKKSNRKCVKKSKASINKNLSTSSAVKMHKYAKQALSRNVRNMMKYNLKRNMCTPRFFGERDYINSMEQFVDRQKDTNPRRTKKFVHDNLEKVFFEKELESVTCNISAPSKDILPDDKLVRSIFDSITEYYNNHEEKDLKFNFDTPTAMALGVLAEEYAKHLLQ